MIDYAGSRNPDLPTISDNDVILGIGNRVNSELYEELVGIDADRYMTSSDISVVSGTASYALPSTFWRFFGKNQGIFRMVNGVISSKLKETHYGSGVDGFYINGGNIVLTPAPTKAETLKLVFTPNVTELTDVDDTVNLPDEYKIKDIFCWALSSLYAEVIGDESRIDLYEQRKFELLNRMRQISSRKPSNVIRMKRAWA